MEYFKIQAKVDIVHVPYRGTGPMLTDLLGGQIQVTFNGVPPIAGQLKAGKLRPLAVGSARRLPTFPEVPTIAETGNPGFETSQWYGVLAPKGAPKVVIDRLQREIVAALADAEATRPIVEDGGVTVGSTPHEFATFIERERTRWEQVVRQANITPE